MIQSWRNVLADFWPAARIHNVGTFGEAEEMLLKGRVDGIVISDSLEDGDPVDFLANARMLVPNLWAFLIAPHAPSSDVQRRLGIVTHIEPGEPENSIFQKVGRALHPRNAQVLLKGTLETLSLNDLVQMKCLQNRPALLRITSNGSEALLYFEAGGVCDCHCDGERGEEAFFRLMQWSDGQFEELALSQVPETTITTDWHSLVMEAAQRQDEAQADR
jgi:hypothetical protein